MAARTLRKKKQQQSCIFFNVIFDVSIHVDNKERARMSDWKQKRRIFWEEKHENSKRLRQWEMLAVSKEQGEKLWGAVKNKSEHEHRRQNIG